MLLKKFDSDLRILPHEFQAQNTTYRIGFETIIMVIVQSAQDIERTITQPMRRFLKEFF